MLELSAYTEGMAEAAVLDTYSERGRGTVVDLLLSSGQLNIGDPVVVGSSFGKVKALIDSSGKNLKVARPPMPVRMLGLRSLPETSQSSGQELLVVETEAKAREIAERRGRVEELRRLSAIETQARLAAEDAALVAEMEAEGLAAADADPTNSPKVAAKRVEQIRLVLKADGQGTLLALEKIVNNVRDLAAGDVNIEVVSKGVGNISLSDIHMLTADPLKLHGATSTPTHSMVLGFNVQQADGNTKATAKQADVQVAHHGVVYRLEDSLSTLTNSVMPKHEVLTSVGTATCTQTFQLHDKGKSVVAGLQVRSGLLNCHGDFIFRVKRNDVYVLPRAGTKRASLRRFKVRELSPTAPTDDGHYFSPSSQP